MRLRTDTEEEKGHAILWTTELPPFQREQGQVDTTPTCRSQAIRSNMYPPSLSPMCNSREILSITRRNIWTGVEFAVLLLAGVLLTKVVSLVRVHSTLSLPILASLEDWLVISGNPERPIVPLQPHLW
jgi:hypothetical protein